MNRPTIIVDQYREAARGEHNYNAYKGLRIHASPGLHEFLADLAVKHVPAASRLIDLAAGSGAMCLRLHDLGYQPVGVDYVSENFGASSIPFMQMDLNGDFSNGLENSFQAIMASEIIEHLENPRHFSRQCFRILQPGGRLILTTPNVDSPGSKAAFLRTGRFLWFSDADYKTEGHITPLTQWQIDKAFTEASFKFLWKGSFNEESELLAGSPRLKLLSKLISRISAIDQALEGEIYAAVLEKPQSA